MAYYFLLTSPGRISAKGLSILVQDWLLDKFRVRVEFDARTALRRLDSLGLLSDTWYDRHLRSDVVTVVPLIDAVKQLQHLSLGNFVTLQNNYRQEHQV